MDSELKLFRLLQILHTSHPTVITVAATASNLMRQMSIKSYTPGKVALSFPGDVPFGPASPAFTHDLPDRNTGVTKLL
jgi:hypothetical protein